jgi:hypothetical protein
MTHQPKPAGAEHEDERSSLERRFAELVRRFWQTPRLPESSPDQRRPDQANIGE